MGRDLRYILAFVYHSDMDKTGALQVLDLLQMLHLAALVTPKTTHEPGFAAAADGSPRLGWAAVSTPTSQPASPEAKQWSERAVPPPSFEAAAAGQALAAAAATLEDADASVLPRVIQPARVLEEYGGADSPVAAGTGQQQQQAEHVAQRTVLEVLGPATAAREEQDRLRAGRSRAPISPRPGGNLGSLQVGLLSDVCPGYSARQSMLHYMLCSRHTSVP